MAEPAATRTVTPLLSVIGTDLVIKGGIEGPGELRLLGRVWGEVKVDRLLVGESGELEGSVKATLVEVRGQVRGPITARHVRLSASASVDGDINYEVLEVEAGAQIEGRCIRNKGKGAAQRAPRPSGATAEPVMAVV